MKVRCDRDVLSEALQTVQRGVSTRPGIPALTGVLIQAEEAGALVTPIDAYGASLPADPSSAYQLIEALRPIIGHRRTRRQGGA